VSPKKGVEAMSDEAKDEVQFTSSERGTIYFIREGDFAGTPVSDYVKIGITGLDRKPGNRVKEIMTGNPRELYVHHAIAVPFAVEIETMMRYEFLYELANLEWHHFPRGSGRQLEDAIEHCQQLRDEFSKQEKIFLEAERLEGVVPSREMIPSSPEAEYWSDSYVLHHHVAKSANAAAAEKRASAKDIVKQGGKAPAGTTVKEIAQTPIDYESFEAAFPEIAAQYRKPKKVALIVDAVHSKPDLEKLNLNDIYRRVTEEVSKFRAIMEQENQDPENDIYAASYRQLLVIQQIAKHSEFRKTVAEWNLKVLCGDSLGIDGICKWERVKETILDKGRLKKEQMDLLSRFRKETKKIMRTEIRKGGKGKPRS